MEGNTSANAQPAATGSEATTAQPAATETNVATGTQAEQVSKRDAWQQRYKQRYAPEAESVDMDSDDYYDNLTKMADEYDRMEGNERQMNDLLNANPSFSGMIRDAKDGKSFFSSLVERFGADNLKQALEDPAVAEEVSKADDAYKERMMKEAEDKETSQRNFDESAANIEQYAKEHNLSSEQVNEVLIKVTDFAKDVFNGVFKPEVLDMFFKSMNYDTDVENARETGRIQGRNENIQAQLERSQQTELPPNIGQSGTLPTKRDTRRKGVMPLSGEEFEY